MSVRVVLTATALPGMGSKLAQAYIQRVPEMSKEPGFEQFEVFQAVEDPDRLVILERWATKEDLDAHEAIVHATPLMTLRPLRPGPPDREDYVYNRTR